MTKLWPTLPTLLLVLSIPALAQDTSPSPETMEPLGLDPEAVARTSIVWLKTGNSPQSFQAELIKRAFNATQPSDQLGNLIVEGDASEIQRQLDNHPDLAEQIDYVEPNGIVRLFPSECVPMKAPAGELVPYGVRRIGGPMELASGLTRRIWVIDSGIASEYDASAGGELNVDRQLAAECDAYGCASGAAEDGFGHGTAVASIIGAMKDGKGLVGMAPGARLVPIKVFDTPETDWASIYPAMAYLISHVAPGDVVNVSFGGPWDPSAGGKPRMIERQLKRLADQGVRVSVAAGNLDALPHSAYVQTVSPARAGAYRAAQAGGAVMTASAIDGEDRFWLESGFGNGEASRSGGLHLGPPDVAEPGVAIPVLWPGGQMRACTGTSFAAPHLAAILLQGLPGHDGQAKGDISATIERPRGPLTDAARNDPIGVCVIGAKGACEVR